MVIGRGDIASVLTDREDITWFASGVSDSSENRKARFVRELKLLMEQPKDRHLVYFSSLSIYYSDSFYARHKKVMETAVKQNFPSYTIVRLGNIEWGHNPNTWINYITNHKDAVIQNVWRHVVSYDEFQYWMNYIQVNTRNEMNIPGKMVWVPDYFRERKVLITEQNREWFKV